MKTKFASKSAFFNPRVLFGFFLCLIGVVVALIGVGMYSTQPASAQTPKENPTIAPDAVQMVGPIALNVDFTTATLHRAERGI